MLLGPEVAVQQLLGHHVLLQQPAGGDVLAKHHIDLAGISSRQHAQQQHSGAESRRRRCSKGCPDQRPHGLLGGAWRDLHLHRRQIQPMLLRAEKLVAAGPAKLVQTCAQHIQQLPGMLFAVWRGRLALDSKIGRHGAGQRRRTQLGAAGARRRLLHIKEHGRKRPPRSRVQIGARHSDMQEAVQQVDSLAWEEMQCG